MIQSPLLQTFGCYIAGTWRTASQGRTIAVVNPATGEHLADVPNMDATDAMEAVKSCETALADVPDIDARRAWLTQIDALLTSHRSELAPIITQEQGKPLKESLAEVDYAAGFFRVAANHIDHIRDRTLDEIIRNARWTVRHTPAGVAGLITPWNFPLAMLAKKLSSAMAAGCPSVTKPADLTPLTLIALWHLLERLNLPPGFANLITGDAAPIGDLFCAHPAVRIISFTGSTVVGKRLMSNVAPHVKRLSLELGGNAPFMVFDDADVEKAADALVANKFRCAGQTCVCANRVLVQRGIEQRFTDAVAIRVGKLRVGNGMADGVDIGPLINRRAWDKVEQHVRDALEKGAQKIIGEQPSRPSDDFGCFYSPQIISGVTREMLVSQEETFGPVIAITSFDDDDDGIALANETPFGLASYFFTPNPSRAQRISRALRFGHVGVNTGSGPIPEAPFGGMNQSGFGREGALEGILEFCEVQVVATED